MRRADMAQCIRCEIDAAGRIHSAHIVNVAVAWPQPTAACTVVLEALATILTVLATRSTAVEFCARHARTSCECADSVALITSALVRAGEAVTISTDNRA